MELTIVPGRDILQINDARITFRNFRGEADDYNDAGNRRFSVIIPSIELAEMLQENVNSYGAGWNVKINPPREDGGDPFIHLPVKVKYTDRSQPNVYLTSGSKTVKLTEDTIDMLDNIDIRSVDLDIRPFDGETRGKAFRAAYLQSIWVTQEVDRFESRFAEEEYPEEY